MALGTVDFYTYTGDPKTANKNLGSVVATSGQIKPLEPLSNLSVLFTIDYKAAAMSCNYIGFGGMYYKIQDRKFLTGGGMEITARIDSVLSYWNQVKESPCVCERSSSIYDSDMNDSKYPVYQKHDVQTKHIDTLDNDDFIVFGIVE